ncbi:alpha/beta hydrolase, partial [Rhodobacteraceae bacterium]|nr:alpha/beta hydrolase [Paracoccaceae bacterium]
GMAAKTPLALIHCALGRAASWRPFLNALGGPISPLLIELPGHGLAEDYDESRDYADQAVELALDEMPSHPVPLVGHSYGAAVALRIAVERPYRVSSLVLVEPVFFAAAKGTSAHDKVLRDLAPFVSKIEAGSTATAARAFHGLWGIGGWDDLPPEDRTYIMSRIGLVTKGHPLIMDDRSNLLASGRLEDLDMPVTFVDGGDSHPVIAEIISALGDRIPDADWATVPDAGHMLPTTHPAQLVEAVKGRLFVERNGA